MKNAAQPKVAVVVVSYNGLTDVRACLKSLRGQDYASRQTYLVDNASTEPVAKMVEREFPEVKLTASQKNLGFAAGNNLGFRQALKDGADYIYLLNPDTEASSDLISQTVKAANAKTIIQPLVLLLEKERTNLVNTDGNVLHFLGFSYCGNYRREAVGEEPHSIAVASGAAMMVPAGFIRKYGGFDESLFMYHEDVDLCWRARLIGYDIVLAPGARVYHRYVFSRNAHKIFYAERNRLLFLLKNYQWWTLLLITPMLIINELVAILFSLISGSFGPKMRSYGSFWRLVPTTLRKRRELQRVRRLTDHELLPLLTGRLDFSAVKIPLIGLYSALVAAYWAIIRLIV